MGGNHPININNSYFFEQIGWKGLAFEPIKELNDLWKKKRSTECIQVVVGDCDKEVIFGEAEACEFSGVLDIVNGSKKIENNTAIINTSKMPQRSLKSVFHERNIKNIDFLSIDVEGYEMNVLKGIDFDNVDIKCIDLENNSNDNCADEEIRKFLYNKGYILVARLEIDDVFVKKCEK